MSLENTSLNCPIRGVLKVMSKSKNGLTHTEEYYRIQAIHYLLKLGYPKENIIIEQIVKQFGNNGRNSLRCDLAVLDVSKTSINHDVDSILNHAVILCEIKRDNHNVEYVKETQVKPLLDFAKRSECIALYWDNLEQRVFWQEIRDGKRENKEGLLNLLPKFGMKLNVKPLTFNDTKPTDSLVEIFDYIEDSLHQQGFDISSRYELILKLLLVKIFDEHSKEGQPDKPMDIQDFLSLGIKEEIAIEKFDQVLKRAVEFYNPHLPKKLKGDFNVSNEVILDILKVLAPIRLTYSKRNIVQAFYMKFAKSLYKWDLAQFFTPTPITDFIVDVVNLKFGEHVFDPACGSADFLVAAFQRAREFNHGHADYIWGNDNSDSAVQVAILNMVLNGDGKTNIQKIDSLQVEVTNPRQFNLILCNPPFGSKIQEKRTNVLQHFDMGYVWERDDQNKRYLKKDKLLTSQETGILFAELCVKKAKDNGKIALIVPNGYLGNRSEKFLIFREWLLKHTKIAGICSLPRFSFKSSGADVSASVLFLEKRAKPLSYMNQTEEYCFFVEAVENLGWEAGNKIAKPIYKRNSIDGTFVLNEENEPVLDSDFPSLLKRIRTSETALNDFKWLQIEDIYNNEYLVNNINEQGSYCVSIQHIINDTDLTLDPKRYLRKANEVKNKIKSLNHIRLGDMVDFLPEKTTSSKVKIQIEKDKKYKYVQLEDIAHGDFSYLEMYGWQLPSRARHFAECGDLYFGSIWGSVSKWCYIGLSHNGFVITNGCHRCRLKKDMEQYLPDLLCFLNTEAWAVQMRSLARGSDGLAEISTLDAANILIPILSKDERSIVSPFIENLKKGTVSLKSFLEMKRDEMETLSICDVEKRPSHIVLV